MSSSSCSSNTNFPTTADLIKYDRQLRRSKRRDVPYEYPSAYRGARSDLLSLSADNCIWDRLRPYDTTFSNNEMMTVEQQRERREEMAKTIARPDDNLKPEWTRWDLRFCWVKSTKTDIKRFMLCMARRHNDSRTGIIERGIVHNVANSTHVKYYIVPESLVLSYQSIYSYHFLWCLHKFLNDNMPSRFAWMEGLTKQLSLWEASRIRDELSWKCQNKHLYLTLNIGAEDAVGLDRLVTTGPAISHTFTGSLVLRHSKEHEQKAVLESDPIIGEPVYVDNPASKYVKLQRGNLNQLVKTLHDAMVCGAALSHFANRAVPGQSEQRPSPEDLRQLAGLLTVDMEAVRGLIWQLNCALTPEMERMISQGTIDEARRLFDIPIHSGIWPQSRLPSSSPIMSLSGGDTGGNNTSQVAPGESAFDRETVPIANADESEVCHVFINVDDDDDAETAE